MSLALKGCEGVKNVAVTFATKEALAVVEKDVDPDALLKAVQNAGPYGDSKLLQ